MAQFVQQTSITRKLTAAVSLLVLLFLVELLGIYLSSRRYLAGVSEIHAAQGFSHEVSLARETADTLGNILDHVKTDPKTLRASTRVFEGVVEQGRKILSRLRLDAGSNTTYLRLLAQADASLTRLDASAHRYFSAPRGSLEKRELFLSKQFHLDLAESLAKLKLDIDRGSNLTFENIYGNRYHPVDVAIGITLLFSALALIVGLTFTRRLKRSFGVLVNQTRQVAFGNLDVIAPVTSRDEIGTLTNAFNEMTSALKISTVSRKYVETVIQSLPDLLLVLGLDGKIRTANEAALHLLGYAGSEIQEMDIRNTLAEPGELERILNIVLQGGPVSDLEKSVLTKTGKQIPALLSVSAIRDAAGKPTGIVFIAKDITERKEAERRIAERNELLSAANKELEAFSYSVSHDLRAPLRSMDGFSKAVLEHYSDKLDERGRGYLIRIRESSQRMARLIDDLLNLSRLGRAELQARTVDLSEMARSIAEDLRSQEPTRKVEFAIEPGITADCDPNLMRAVLENLLSNSWKFTSKHPHARIQFGTIPHDGGRAFFVRDDGAGFDMAFAGKLFGAFQRLHSNSEFPGTGIGLALVKRIISKHGGSVWAEAHLEKGATFYFTLKEKEAEHEHPAYLAG